mgnify:CR=1 FL=1|tara:strand:+ start:11219 stop:11542 length:324 start_codon:yes stop_codon:yes gene_type:complete
MKSPIKLLFIFLSTCSSFLNLPHLADINPELAVSIVKTSTAILPQFDSIGHLVLSSNELLINKVLESNFDPALKKKFILYIIDVSRQGDEMGGKILSNYYKLIDNIL